MKSAKKIVSAVLLSVSLVTSSFPWVYANTENPVNNVKPGAIQAQEVIPSFLSGSLTAASDKAPQQIVEQYILQEAQKYQLPSVQFKVTEQFVNSMNRTVVKTVQTYNGVPVQNSDRNYFINSDGVIVYIVGSYVYDIADRMSLAVKPEEVSQDTILSVIEKDLGFKPIYTETPKSQLLLYPVDGKYNYIYKVNIKFKNPAFKSYIYYLYASNLSVLGKNNQELSLEEPAVGSGIGQSGMVKQPLKMVKDNNVYYLKNTVEKLKTIHELDGIYSENDNNFDTDTGLNFQKDAVDAHYNMTNVINFFKGAPFYRNGNDDNGSEYTIEIIKDSGNVFNAFADTNEVRIGAGKGLAGKSVAFAVDAMAHEFTHGILKSEGLGDSSDGHFEFNPPLTERLSLHEGISDVFGTICEYFLPSEGTSDWTIAEDTGTILRDCANPVIDTYNEYNRRILECENDRSLKYPKPHEGGGVITKAASLMAMGGTFKNVTVNPIGMEKLAEIFYHAINDGNMVYDMKFSQFAAALVESSEALYGADSAEVNSVRKALGAVGLDLRIVYASGPSLSLTWLPLSGSHYGIYRREKNSTAEPVKILETTNTKESVQAIPGSYDYFVAAIDASGNRVSAFSSPLTYTLPFAAPQNFHITNRTGLEVGFGWEGTIGTRYGIFRKLQGSETLFEKCAETTNTTVSVTALYGNYDYYVAQIDENGNIVSTSSLLVTVSTQYPAPQNFHITNRSGLIIGFGWTGTSGTKYAIYRQAQGSTAPLEKCAETTNTTVSLNTIYGNYNYYVAQIDENGEISSFLSNSVLVNTQYPAPSNFHIANRSGLQINFSWEGTSGARYAIYKVAADSTELPEKCMETTSTTATVYTLIGSYNFYVAQIDEAGNRISFLSQPVTVNS